MKRIILALLLLSSPAMAQQQPPPSASEQALGSKLMEEIQGGLNYRAGLLGVQADLVKAKARIKELEEKAASDPPPPK